MIYRRTIFLKRKKHCQTKYTLQSSLRSKSKNCLLTVLYCTVLYLLSPVINQVVYRYTNLEALQNYIRLHKR